MINKDQGEVTQDLESVIERGRVIERESKNTGSDTECVEKIVVVL